MIVATPFTSSASTSVPLTVNVTFPVASLIVTVISDAIHWVISGTATSIAGQSFLVTSIEDTF